jgi:arsenate reductase (thioredoxin)
LLIAFRRKKISQTIMTSNPPIKVFILCTGNSARSIIGEYLLRKKGRGRFEVHSAGSKPTGRVNPFAIWVLKEHFGIDASDGRSKSWDEFKDIKFDAVITVCDNAKEACPVWPGTPILAHWGSPDSAGVEGNDEQKKQAFLAVATQISRRIDLMCALPREKLLQDEVRNIGMQFKLENEDSMKR